MILIYAAILVLSPPRAETVDTVAAARRIAASVQLAAQEYRNGVVGGRVVAQAEVDEAKLFLTEAKRSAALLPSRVVTATLADLDHLLFAVNQVNPPDSVLAFARRSTDSLGKRLGVVLEDIPARTPSLARGAELFKQECSSCHGATGHGDGPAGLNLKPRPADLTDWHGLADATPLSIYQRVTIGVAGTAMPSFETKFAAADRWALALYAMTLHQVNPAGAVPTALREFGTVAKLNDLEIKAMLAPDSSAERLSAVRAWQPQERLAPSTAVFATVRTQVRNAGDLARAGNHDSAVTAAFDAYMTFEQVETTVRAKKPDLATSLEAAFATLRNRAAGGATPIEIDRVERDLLGGLEEAERVISDQMSPKWLFVQSLGIMLREGLEAILIIGALIAFLMKMGAGHRKRDIHIGVGAAIAMSLLTAVLLETVFVLSSAHREALEGITLVAAVGVLFYVSYWLLSKMEVAKWTAFVKERLQVAVTGGSAFALASAAFLAVYREGFETVLFYQALFISGGTFATTFLPVTLGIVVGGAMLGLVYFAINRWGVKLPLKPFFAITSVFLYYMAFVFAGTAMKELQEGGLISNTILLGRWPRIPALGIYPTLESMAAQGLLLLLALVAVAWIFVLQRPEPQRSVVVVPTAAADHAEVMLKQDAVGGPMESTVLRSLERMEADLAALRSEVERVKQAVTESSADEIAKR